jgi:uncharacterized membrane protein
MNKKGLILSAVLVVMLFILASALSSLIDNIGTESGVLIPVIVSGLSSFIASMIIKTKSFKNFVANAKEEDAEM